LKLLVISVGRPRNRLYKSEVEEYHHRVAASISCEWMAVPESTGRVSAAASIAVEGARILKKMNKRDYCVILDQNGRSMTSSEFSKWIFFRLGSVPGRMVLVVGGAFGLSELVKERSDMKLSLSGMTLTHEMSLLLLFEQLYRAVTIEKGGSYHH
jgi:23S rRNA (pseudouridine1915-N3)-methyltransferase